MDILVYGGVHSHTTNLLSKVHRPQQGKFIDDGARTRTLSQHHLVAISDSFDQHTAGENHHTLVVVKLLGNKVGGVVWVQWGGVCRDGPLGGE